MSMLRFERRYPHPPQRVWRALTERAAIGEWGMKTDDFAPRVGAKFVLRGEPNPRWRGFVECQVVECVPEKVLAYRWQAEASGPRTLVRFELAADGDGTRLVLEHSGFSGAEALAFMNGQMRPGWTTRLDETIPRVLARLAAE